MRTKALPAGARLGLLWVLLACAACGQTGPLYLPAGGESAATTTAPGEADTSRPDGAGEEDEEDGR